MPETSPARHPLLERLIRDCGVPEVDAGGVDAFLATPGNTVLFFSEDLKQYPESADIAVILPELIKAFGGRLRAAFVARANERELQKRYGFARWPALVFLRDGEYVGAITGMHDWDVFLAKVQGLLDAPTRREAAAAAARANRVAAASQEVT